MKTLSVTRFNRPEGCQHDESSCEAERSANQRQSGYYLRNNQHVQSCDDQPCGEHDYQPSVYLFVSLSRVRQEPNEGAVETEQADEGDEGRAGNQRRGRPDLPGRKEARIQEPEQEADCGLCSGI